MYACGSEHRATKHRSSIENEYSCVCKYLAQQMVTQYTTRAKWCHTNFGNGELQLWCDGVDLPHQLCLGNHCRQELIESLLSVNVTVS